jgi:hypothetical protein
MRKRGAAFWLLTLLAVWTAVNGVIADWNSHMFNPAWTPHAKYHDAVSIAASILLGIVGFFYVWRRGARSKDDLDYSVVAMCTFWCSLLLGFAFPGTAGTVAEHPDVVPRIGGLWLNEVFIATTSMGATLIAWWFERKRRSAQEIGQHVE